MRKKFTVPTAMLVALVSLTGITACGDRVGDDLESVDRELDLAMAEDSAAELQDLPDQAQQEHARTTAPPPASPPPASTPQRRTRTVEPEPEPRYRNVTMGAGATLRVRLDEELSTRTSNVGDEFSVTLLSPLTDDTHVILPAGTRIRGKVTALEPSGSSGDQAMIRLDFGQVELDGNSHIVPMTVAEANPTTRGRKSTEEKAVTIGAGAVVGGILGRVIGGNATGTIIGGVAGAAAGTAIALGTGDVDAVLEEGSEMVLRVEESVTVRRPA